MKEGKKEREERLAQQLRANLKRRKSQARELKGVLVKNEQKQETGGDEKGEE